MCASMMKLHEKSCVHTEKIRTRNTAECFRGHAGGEDRGELGHAHPVLRAKALKTLARVEEQALVIEKEQDRRQGVVRVCSETKDLCKRVVGGTKHTTRYQPEHTPPPPGGSRCCRASSACRWVVLSRRRLNQPYEQHCRVSCALLNYANTSNQQVMAGTPAQSCIGCQSASSQAPNA